MSVWIKLRRIKRRLWKDVSFVVINSLNQNEDFSQNMLQKFDEFWLCKIRIFLKSKTSASKHVLPHAQELKFSKRIK
jgi:hypothetical protein